MSRLMLKGQCRVETSVYVWTNCLRFPCYCQV